MTGPDLKPGDAQRAGGAAAPPCPECGRPATGNFCAHCGAELGGRFCDQCGAAAAPEARFCNQCGAPARGRAEGERAGAGGAGAAAARAGSPGRGAHVEAARFVVAGPNLPWWIAGAAMFILIVVLGVSMVRPGGPQGPAASSAPAGAGAAAVDLSSMTPIEAATRLFNRVMTAVEQGDSSEARAFLPMAIAAYDRARPLDHDGLYHLSVLQAAAGQLDAALDNATLILDEDPNHLLGLLAAAHAAAELGLSDEARQHYRHLLEVYDAEMARGLQEYEDHVRTVSSARGEAQAFLAGR